MSMCFVDSAYGLGETLGVYIWTANSLDPLGIPQMGKDDDCCGADESTWRQGASSEIETNTHAAE
jgi:hypothetical protein